MNIILYLLIITFILFLFLVFIFSKKRGENEVLEFGDWVNPFIQNNIITGKIKEIVFKNKESDHGDALAEVLLSVNLLNYFIDPSVENIEIKVLINEYTLIYQKVAEEVKDIGIIELEMLKINDRVMIRVEEDFKEILRINNYTAVSIQRTGDKEFLYGGRLEFSEIGERANGIAGRQILSGEIKNIKKNEEGEIEKISIKIFITAFFREFIIPTIVKEFIVIGETEFYEGLYQEKHLGEKTNSNIFQEGDFVFLTAKEDFREILKNGEYNLDKIKRINNREIFENHLKEGNLMFEN
jgi:hypothetical protein